MEIITKYDTIIKNVLIPYTEIPYSHGELVCQPIFDDRGFRRLRSLCRGAYRQA